QTTLIVQIEDIAALDHVEAIANTDVDALFIGRADLAVAMDKSVSDAAVIDTVAQICKTASAAGKAVGMFTPRLDELPDWRAMGASLFLLGSDHGFLLQGANALASTARQSHAPSE
ncbi:MAG: aldolase/citrate lyase family protein, partial [Pseudomonadota bacterium]